MSQSIQSVVILPGTPTNNEAPGTINSAVVSSGTAISIGGGINSSVVVTS